MIQLDRATERRPQHHRNCTTETYTYSEDGYLAVVGGPAVTGSASGERARYMRDTLGRVTGVQEYQQAGGYIATRKTFYDAGGRSNRVSSEESRSFKTESGSVVEYRGLTTNTYSGTVLASSITDNSKRTTSGGVFSQSGVKDTSMVYTYLWYDGAVQYTSDYDSDTGDANTLWHNGFTYDDYGRLTRVEVADGRSRSIRYTNNSDGQVIHRFEDETGFERGNPTLINHIFNGKLIGQIGNNGDENLSYAEALNQKQQQANATGSGPFAGGTNTNATPWSDYDQSYQAINPGSVSATTPRCATCK